MRVCMVVHAYYEKDARVRAYAASLVKAGHTVDVLSLRLPGRPREYEYDGVTVRGISLGRRRGAVGRYVLEYASSLTRFAAILTGWSLSGRRYDLVHAHNFPNAVALAAFVPRALGARVLLDVHDPWPELFQSKYVKDGDHWMVRLLRIEERLSCRFAHQIIVANHLFKESLVGRGIPADRINVVMNAPRGEFFRSLERRAQPESSFRVLYVGTLAPRYGLPVLIKAVARIVKSGVIPGVQLSVVPKLKDEGSYVGDLISLAREEGLGDRFEILDPVPHEDMPTLIERFDVSAYTPEPDVHRDRALSLKIPEVLAVGRPVVASRLTVLEHYFGDESLFMFRPGEVDDCAAKLVAVHSNPEEAQARVENARDVLHTIGWAKQEATYLSVVDSLTAQEASDLHTPAVLRRMRLKRRARRAVVTVSAHTGLARLIAGDGARPTLRVLAYHNVEQEPSNSFSVSVDAFRAQMEILRDHHSVLSLGEAIDALHSRPSRAAVAITFDDGWLGVFDNALPILEEFELPATCFVVGLAPGRDPRFMDWDTVRRLTDSGLVDVGSHAMRHSELQRLAGHELEWEVGASKELVEKELRREVRFFAYPYGTPRHFNDTCKHAVASAGYGAAFTAVNGVNDRTTDLFELRRTKVEWGDDRRTFERMLRGGIDVWRAVDHLLSLRDRRKEVSFSRLGRARTGSGAYPPGKTEL